MSAGLDQLPRIKKVWSIDAIIFKVELWAQILFRSLIKNLAKTSLRGIYEFDVKTRSEGEASQLSILIPIPFIKTSDRAHKITPYWMQGVTHYFKVFWRIYRTAILGLELPHMV